MDESTPVTAPETEPENAKVMPEMTVFRISPLIRLTLLLLYVALTVPLPFLAAMTQAAIAPSWLAAGLAIGFLLLYAALSERVVVDGEGIRVTYPGWVPKFWRSGWFLPWDEVQALKPRTTGQGGLVYYFLSLSGEGYLLPMRIAGFAKLVRLVTEKTGIDTRDVKPLAQPWMYLILLGFTLLLLAVDAWTVTTVMSGGLV